MTLHEGDEVEVALDAVDDEGRGRGVHDEWDVAVRGGCVGDVVRATVERVFGARKLAQARLLEVVDDGELAVERGCPHDEPCAGCPLEGVDEGFTWALKRARVEQALAEAGLTVDVDDVEPARHPRQKVKLTATVRDGGRIQLGLYVPHSHDLVPAHQCAFVEDTLRAALARLLPQLEQAPLLIGGALKALVGRVFTRERVGVVVVVREELSEDDLSVLRGAVDDGTVASLSVRHDAQGGNSIVGGRVVQTWGPRELEPLEGGPAVDVDAFCQPDPLLARHMSELAARYLVAGDAGERTLPFVDAYAGTGGFARALVERGAQHVIAIERAEASARALSALERVEPIAKPVEDALALLRERKLGGLVLDPPRAGLRELAPRLASLDAPRAVIVACDPDAGAKDAKAFVDAGWRVERVLPLDMFPGTPDVETMLFLSH